MSSGLMLLDKTPGTLLMITFLRTGDIPVMILRHMMKKNGFGSRKYAGCFKVLKGLELIIVNPVKKNSGHRVNKVSLSSKGIEVHEQLLELTKHLP